MVPMVPCPLLVGRAGEVAALVAALDAASAGRGGLVLVVGEAGIGKSRLAQETAAMAASRGMAVLRGRALPGSGAVAFRPLVEALVTAVPEAAADPDLEPWLPVLARLSPLLPPPPAGVDAPAPVLGEAVLRLLTSWCAGGAVLLVLEDLQWADPETLEVIEHLSDHLGRAPVVCLATVRIEDDGAARDLVGRVTARRTATVLRPPRLTDAQVAAMVHSCTGDAPAVERVARLADGVPFLVEELLLSSGLPASFVDGVADRLALLPETDRRVLVTAAAFGHRFDWRLVGAATGMSQQEVVEALERGLAAQLLAVDGDDFTFRHALTAEAVFASVTPARRAAIAAAALAALDHADGDPAEDGWEVVAPLAERAGQRERAGRLHVRAGERALRRGALHTAVAAMDRAAALLPPGEVRDRARERLVEALGTAGRIDDALVAAEGLVERLPPDREVAVRLHLTAAALTASRWDLADGQLAAARRIIASGGSGLPPGRSSLRASAELAIREAELALGTSDPVRAERRATDALELARREGLHEAECAALQVLGRGARRSSLPDAEAWFTRALRTAEAHGLPLWRLRALHELGTIELLDRSAVTALLEAHAQAEALGAVATAVILDLELAAGHHGLHDIDGQARHGLEAARRGAALGLDLVAAYGWLHVAGAAALHSDAETLDAATAHARAAAPGNADIEGLVVGNGDLVIALLADDHDAAVDAAGRCAALLRGSQTAPPVVFRAMWPLLLAVGGDPDAPAALEEVDQAGVAVSRAARGCLTMTRAVLAGRADPTAAAELAAAADADLTHFPPWQSIVRRLAAATAAADRWTIPTSWLPEAEAWLRDHGYPALADACLVLRRRSLASLPAGWVRLGITRREADVLELVIDGLPNREIAQVLHLSVRTVEKHVEALLRKTATRSRTQLARVATTTT